MRVIQYDMKNTSALSTTSLVCIAKIVHIIQIWCMISRTKSTNYMDCGLRMASNALVPNAEAVQPWLLG
jgi:hypothetical protein